MYEYIVHVHNGHLVSVMSFIGDCMPASHSPSRGDVGSDSVHMGIAAGNNQTVSANAFIVVKNDWGFRPRQSIVWREYSC